MSDNPVTAMVFSGGLALASYHAGVYQEFHERRLPLGWVAGSSLGAVTAALIAGNRPSDVIPRLRAFWNMPTSCIYPLFDHPWNYINGWLNVAGSHLHGSAGHFRQRFSSPTGFQSLYDLGTMRRRLRELIDFEHLNSGTIRLSIAATDVETGDPAIFDSLDGPIEMDHLMASCGFLPEFATVAIDGRTYVDGGLSLNAPFEPVLQAASSLRLFIVDLFARDGARPGTLEEAAERKTDLTFGNQTFLRLKPILSCDRLSIRIDRFPTKSSIRATVRDLRSLDQKSPLTSHMMLLLDAGGGARSIWRTPWTPPAPRLTVLFGSCGGPVESTTVPRLSKAGAFFNDAGSGPTCHLPITTQAAQRAPATGPSCIAWPSCPASSARSRSHGGTDHP